MRKFIFSLVIMMMTVMSANAQTALQEQKFFDNVFVSVGGGVSTPLDFNSVFPLNPSATISVGKWFNPVVGAEIEGTAWFGSHDSQGTENRWDLTTTHNAFRGSYVGLNGLVNFNNLFCGYNGNRRFFEVNGVVGLGWEHFYRPGVNDRYSNGLGVKTGLDLAFNLGKQREHAVSIRPAVLWNLSSPGNAVNGLAFNKMGAQLYLGVAYTYHFKTSNGTHSFKKYDVTPVDPKVIEKIVEKKVVVNKEVVKEVVKPVQNTWTVYFAKNSDVLTDAAKAELDKIGQNAVVEVYATASPEGTDEYNLALSQKRADAVKAYLEERGVKVAGAEGRGVIGPESNRVAVVTMAE